MLRFPRHRPRLAELEPPGLQRPKALRVAGQIELREHAHAARGRVRHLSSLVLLFFSASYDTEKLLLKKTATHFAIKASSITTYDVDVERLKHTTKY